MYKTWKSKNSQQAIDEWFGLYHAKKAPLQIKKKSTQEYFCNMVAGGEVKDDVMLCFILTYLDSVNVQIMKNETCFVVKNC